MWVRSVAAQQSFRGYHKCAPMLNAPLKEACYRIYLGLRHDIGPFGKLVIDDMGLSFVDGVALDLNENLTGRLL